MGHRGACAEHPENTLASFQRAIEIGVDVLETDVHMTADGVVVVSHDADGMRAANVERSIAACALDEVQSWDAGWGYRDADGQRTFAGHGLCIPTLDELLDLAGDVRLNIDIKQREPSMVEPLLALLLRRAAASRVTLASFFGPVIREVRRRGYEGETVLAQDEVTALLLTPTWLCRAIIPRGQSVQVPLRAGPFELASKRFIDKCHALDLRVEYWTINDPVVAEVLLERGADGVISDDPAALVDVFARYREDRR
jgi:glycerophosphoryl diester phosphodiesterase